MVLNKCRLCLRDENLVWVFDKRFENENMNEVVYITTGVVITTKDVVSQNICGKCCQVTIRMYQFRETAQSNDMYLKERYKECKNQNNIETSNSEDTTTEVENNNRIVIKTEPPEISDTSQEEAQDNRVLQIHPSVQALYNLYSGLKLPNICLQSDFAPFVSLPMSGVENYYKDRNLDFNLHAKLALQPPRAIATKKTSAATKPKKSSVISHKNEKDSNSRVIGVEVNRDNSTNKISIKFTKQSTEPNNKTNSPLASSVVSVSNCKSNVKTKPDSDLKIKQVEKKMVKMKRKISEVENTSQNEVIKKPAFIESLGLTANPNTSESPAYVANVSVPLHICNLCNSVQYSAKDLRKHQNKHLRCQFCKVKLRSLDSKKEHLNNLCVVKNAMNGLPDVILEKIEYNEKIRQRYPAAFSSFRSLSNATTVTCSGAKLIEETISSAAPEEISSRPPIPSNNPDIIEIVSDDDEPMPTPTKKTGIPNRFQRITHQKVENVLASKNEANANSLNSIPQSSVSIPPALLPIPQNIVYNTVSIVKPDVRLSNSKIFDNIDPKISDTKLLKDLLLKYTRKSIQPFTEQCTQTDLPENNSISILNQADKMSELKNLKQQLYAYKIPVVIRNGPFNVSYENSVMEKPSAKLDLWLDLTPIDIKSNTPKPSNSKKQIVQENERQAANIDTRTNSNYAMSSSATVETTDLAKKTSHSLPSIVPCSTPVTNNSSYSNSNYVISSATVEATDLAKKTSHSLPSIVPYSTPVSNNSSSNKNYVISPSATVEATDIVKKASHSLPSIVPYSTPVSNNSSNRNYVISPSATVEAADLSKKSSHSLPSIVSYNIPVSNTASSNSNYVISSSATVEATDLAKKTSHSLPSIVSYDTPVSNTASSNNIYVTSSTTVEATDLATKTSQSFPCIVSYTTPVINNASLNSNYVMSSSATPEATDLAKKTSHSLPSIVPHSTPVNSNSPKTYSRSVNVSEKIAEYMATPSTCTGVSKASASTPLVPQANNNTYNPLTFNALRSAITQPHTIASKSPINELRINHYPLPNSNIGYSNNNQMNNLVEPHTTTPANHLTLNPTLPPPALVPSNPITIGAIRVKHVWELT